MKKRILSMILAVSMMLTLLPVSAFAAWEGDVTTIKIMSGAPAEEGGSNWSYTKIGLIRLDSGNFTVSSICLKNVQINANNSKIVGGAYNGNVFISGTDSTSGIEGGTFSVGVTLYSGVINGGTFKGDVTVRGSAVINGGVFDRFNSERVDTTNGGSDDALRGGIYFNAPNVNSVRPHGFYAQYEGTVAVNDSNGFSHSFNASPKYDGKEFWLGTENASESSPITLTFTYTGSAADVVWSLASATSSYDIDKTEITSEMTFPQIDGVTFKPNGKTLTVTITKPLKRVQGYPHTTISCAAPETGNGTEESPRQITLENGKPIAAKGTNWTYSESANTITLLDDVFTFDSTFEGTIIVRKDASIYGGKLHSILSVENYGTIDSAQIEGTLENYGTVKNSTIKDEIPANLSGKFENCISRSFVPGAHTIYCTEPFEIQLSNGLSLQYYPNTTPYTLCVVGGKGMKITCNSSNITNVDGKDPSPYGTVSGNTLTLTADLTDSIELNLPKASPKAEDYRVTLNGKELNPSFSVNFNQSLSFDAEKKNSAAGDIDGGYRFYKVENGVLSSAAIPSRELTPGSTYQMAFNVKETANTLAGEVTSPNWRFTYNKGTLDNSEFTLELVYGETTLQAGGSTPYRNGYAAILEVANAPERVNASVRGYRTVNADGTLGDIVYSSSIPWANVGTYQAVISYSSENYTADEATSETWRFTITPADISTMSDHFWEEHSMLTTDLQGIDLSKTRFTYTRTEQVDGEEVVFVDTMPNIPGEYYIDLTLPEGGNYEGTVRLKFTRKVEQREVTEESFILPDADGLRFDYDGTEHAVSVKAKDTLDPAPNFSILYYDADGNMIEGTPVEAGTYTYSIKVEGDLYYAATEIQPKNNTIIIDAHKPNADEDISIDVNKATYNGEEQEPEISFSTASGIDPENVRVNYFDAEGNALPEGTKPSAVGKYTFTITVFAGENNEGADPADDSTWKEFTYGPYDFTIEAEPVYDITVEDNYGTAQDADGKTITSAKEGDKVYLKVELANLPENYQFKSWSVVSPADLKLETDDIGTYFTMPGEAVTVKANLSKINLDPDDPEDPDKPNDPEKPENPDTPMTPADIAATAAGGVVAGAAFGAAGYLAGTQIYLSAVLPKGAAIPTSRQALAVLLWETAGKPEPAATTAYTDLTEDTAQKAAQWCVEQGLIPAKGTDTFLPSNYVTRIQVIKSWNALQKLLKQ